MEMNEIKRENRQALPKYLLVLLLCAIGGGALGFAAGWVGHSSLSEEILETVGAALTALAPWAMAVTGLGAVGAIWALYRRAKRLFSGWDGEDEATMDRAEELLNWGLLLDSVEMVLGMFFFAVGMEGQGPGAVWCFVLFILTMLLLVLFQQKIGDLTRRMAPEKQGSVYDLRFKKKWLESCDEAEQRQIGQAAYKAFNVVNGACGLLWVLLILLSYAFHFSVQLPVFLVCLLWLLLSVTYTLECIRLGRRKG